LGVLDDRTKEALLALGAHLRTARDKLGVSQVQLAKRIKMDPANLLKVERGQKNVTLDTLLRIADGLGMELVVRLRPAKKPRPTG